MRTIVRHEGAEGRPIWSPERRRTAYKMRVGPSDSGCRARVQTTGSCSGSMAGVVSVSEKAGQTRQVRARKTNVSEPLLTCRKRRDVIETGVQSLPRDKVRGMPADCSGGDRHKGGVSPAQACMRNVGTCDLDAQGRPPSGRPARGRVPMRGAGADRLVVAMKPGNAGGAKGPDDLAEGAGQPAMGGARA